MNLSKHEDWWRQHIDLTQLLKYGKKCCNFYMDFTAQ
jgi:hypothetical protein